MYDIDEEFQADILNACFFIYILNTSFHFIDGILKFRFNQVTIKLQHLWSFCRLTYEAFNEVACNF